MQINNNKFVQCNVSKWSDTLSMGRFVLKD